MTEFEIERSIFSQKIMSRPDLAMQILWPKNVKNLTSTKVESLLKIPEVVNWTKRVLTKNALRNLLIQLCLIKDNNLENCKKNVSRRLKELWDKCGVCYFILVEPSGLPVEPKSSLRIEKADDIMMVVNSICFPNSLHFIFNGYPYKYINTLSLILKFRDLLSAQHTSIENYLVDSSSVLSLYGIRQANDLDYLTVSREKIDFMNGIDEHGDDQKVFYSTPISDLIYDHSHHFYFCNIKFLSLRDLLLFKQTRYKQNGDIKDCIDIKLIQLFLQGTSGIRRKWTLLRIWQILTLVRIKNKIQSYGF